MNNIKGYGTHHHQHKLQLRMDWIALWKKDRITQDVTIDANEAEH